MSSYPNYNELFSLPNSEDVSWFDPEPPTGSSSDMVPHDQSFPLPLRDYSVPDQPDAMASNKSEPMVASTKPKHKRENRYKNAPQSVLNRRRAQNRASQRAYRERKDQRIKDLEGILSETQRKNASLSEAYHNLQLEIQALKGQQAAPVPWPPPVAWDGTVGTPAFVPDTMLYFPPQGGTGFSM